MSHIVVSLSFADISMTNDNQGNKLPGRYVLFSSGQKTAQIMTRKGFLRVKYWNINCFKRDS